MSDIPYFKKNIELNHMNYVPDVREKIKEIIFQWGQLKSWDEERVRQAALMIGYVDRFLLVGTDAWGFVADMFSKVDMYSKNSMLKYDSAEYCDEDLCGPKGEMGPSFPTEYKEDPGSAEKQNDFLIHAIGDSYNFGRKKRIFTLDEELKNGEL